MTPRLEDPYRLRLEGGAELLEATVLRYRALAGALSSLAWKTALRRNAAVLRAVIEAQAEVEKVLTTALRRAQAEGWPKGTPILACAVEVEQKLRALVQLAARRAKKAPALGAMALLEALEQGVVQAPRTVLPGRRWATAVEVLRAPLAELSYAVAFGRVLEGLFSRPGRGESSLPLSSEEVVRLARAWPQGAGALALVWDRLERVDKTRRLPAHLRSLARQAPKKPPRDPAEEFLRAAFWFGVAESRLDAFTEARLSPVQPTESERFEVVRWLLEKQTDPAASLEGLPEGRAALLEVAFALGQARTRRRGDLAAGPLLGWASLADAASGGSDYERLRDDLEVLVRARFDARARRAGPRTLEALLRLALGR